MYDLSTLKNDFAPETTKMNKSDEKAKLLEKYNKECYTVHELCKSIANDNFKVQLNASTLKAVFGEVQGKRYSAYFADEIKALQLMLLSYMENSTKEKKSAIIKAILGIFDTFGLPNENISKITAKKLTELAIRTTRYTRKGNTVKPSLVSCFQFLMIMVNTLSVNVNYAHFIAAELTKLNKQHNKHILDGYEDMFIVEQIEQAEQAEQADNN